MSGTSAQRVDIAIPSTRPLRALGAVVWGIGVLLVWTSGLPVPARLALTVAALTYLLLTIRSWRTRPDWQRVVRDSAGAWWLEDVRGTRHPIEPLASSVVSPWLVIFQGRLHTRGRVSLWLPASRLDPEQFRRLSTWLRLID